MKDRLIAADDMSGESTVAGLLVIVKDYANDKELRLSKADR